MFQSYILRIGNGENFEKSKHLNIWGIIGRFKNSIKEFNSNTILTFVKKGNIIIGFAKFVNYTDIRDEPLISINTETKEDLMWIDFEKYPIQIKYEDFIEFKKEIKFINNLGQSSLIKFDKNKHKLDCEYNLLDIINIKYNY